MTDRVPSVNKLAKFAVVERWRRLCAEHGEVAEIRPFLTAKWVDAEIERLKATQMDAQAKLS